MNLFEGVELNFSDVIGFNINWITGAIIVSSILFGLIVVLISPSKQYRKRKLNYIHNPIRQERQYYRQAKKYYAPKVKFNKPSIKFNYYPKRFK